jgi:hypothetical protein
MKPEQLVDLRTDIDAEIPHEVLEAARIKAAAAVRELVYRLFPMDLAVHRAWGYKEIWNGADWARHDWACYDAVFPGAHWLNIVRHPLRFALSAAGWNKDELSREYLAARFKDWVDILAWSRLRASTGRYYEIRFEDLIAAPRRALLPVLKAVGLKWTHGMDDAVRRGAVLRSSHASGIELEADDVNAAVHATKGVRQHCESLGYELGGGETELHSALDD